MASEYDLPVKVDCGDCVNRQKWAYDTKGVSKYCQCRIARHKILREAGRTYSLKTIVNNPDMYNVNPVNCDNRHIRETIKNSRLWVSLYFKGREKDWIVVEPNRHEILVQGNWFVRKVFGMADKFHAWQDKRREKKWLAAEAKRKAAVLTHIVKELPRAS